MKNKSLTEILLAYAKQKSEVILIIFNFLSFKSKAEF